MDYVSEESGYIVPTLALPHGLEPFGDTLPPCLTRAIAPDPSVRSALFDGASFDTEVVALLRQIGPAVLSGLSDAELASVCTRADTAIAGSGRSRLLRRRSGARRRAPVDAYALMVRSRKPPAAEPMPTRR